MSVGYEMEIDRRADTAPPASPPPFDAFLDAESVGAPGRLLRKAVEDGGGKDAAWLEEHARDGALVATHGHLVCWAVVTLDGREWVECGPDERALLGSLADVLSPAGRVIAHGSANFDFPFAWGRAGAHLKWARDRGDHEHAAKMRRLCRILDPRNSRRGTLIDTLDPEWCPRPRHSPKGFSLDDVAGLFGIHRPKTTPGKEIPAAFYAGRLAEVRDHCLDDARTLRAVFPHLAAMRGEDVIAAAR